MLDNTDPTNFDGPLIELVPRLPSFFLGSPVLHKHILGDNDVVHINTALDRAICLSKTLKEQNKGNIDTFIRLFWLAKSGVSQPRFPALFALAPLDQKVTMRQSLTRTEFIKYVSLLQDNEAGNNNDNFSWQLQNSVAQIGVSTGTQDTMATTATT